MGGMVAKRVESRREKAKLCTISEERVEKKKPITTDIRKIKTSTIMNPIVASKVIFIKMKPRIVRVTNAGNAYMISDSAIPNI